MNSADPGELRDEIKALIGDIAFQSESLDDLGRMPVIQMKVLLGKLNKLTEKTIILLHYIERGQSTAKGTSQLSEESKKKEGHLPASVQKEEVRIENMPDILEKLGKSHVDDLMTVIGINEKYLFAGALFEGKNAEFMMAVSDINTFTDRTSLEKYLNDLAHRYGWDAENDIVKRFIELSGRKFD